MRASTRGILLILCAGLVIGVAHRPAQSASISKSQYISLWTSACMAGGSSNKLKLSSGERGSMMMVRPYLEAYRSTGVAMGQKEPPLKQMIRDACGCMARYIAGRKSNLMAPTPGGIAVAAWDRCLSKP